MAVRSSIMRLKATGATPVALKMTFVSARALSSDVQKIIYTITDEAPALATYSLLPVIQRFAKPAGINVETSDISVAARIINLFPELLTPEQRVEDNLAKLGVLAKTPEANIVKLPNVSASVPQLEEAIEELQSQGYAIPCYPAMPKTEEEEAIKAKYATVLGSAVNPVLREGNSDRRVAPPVKVYAQKNPKIMGDWSPSSQSHVAHMESGDFYESEQSATMAKPETVRIELVANDGSTTVLRDNIAVESGEVIDAARMSISALKAFFEKEISDCAEKNLMISLHLKATMMKVSDPIMFGHCVDVFYKDALAKHAATLEELGCNTNNGIGDIYEKIQTLPDGGAAIKADLDATFDTRPGLAMVDSRKGITNLHVPSDVIIDASMPNVVRDSGMMWNADDKLEDVKCMIPDRCYATSYNQMLTYCKEHGQFSAATMGNVSNVGLMAQKAEEYGSHPNTFEVPSAGTVRVVDSAGDLIFAHEVEQGDIWRMCQTKDAPIKDWVKLGVSRARATGNPAVFWLDASRAHDASIIAKVEQYLPEHDTSGLEMPILKPADAMQYSMERATAGLDTISVTGNVLRDYLTDLFPILELGTSAKMLSIVPMLNGGAMYETGAGGSAPKHVEQFQTEGHLRWDSLGEYLATAVSLQDMGSKFDNKVASDLGDALMDGVSKWLDENKTPGRKVMQPDNRAANFYLAMYWAEAMAKRDDSYAPLAQSLADAEGEVMEDLTSCQGSGVDLGGYYKPCDEKAAVAMRPSAKFNEIIDNY